MKYRVTLEVEANQMQSDGKFTHDCGICRWRAGDWVIDDPEYGPCAISDEEFRQRFTPVEAVPHIKLCGPGHPDYGVREASAPCTVEWPKGAEPGSLGEFGPERAV
jgi:hypothetical protein